MLVVFLCYVIIRPLPWPELEPGTRSMQDERTTQYTSETELTAKGPLIIKYLKAPVR